MIFGPPPIEPSLLAAKLVPELLMEVQQQGKESDWTGILKAILRKMGEQRGHVVNPNPDEGQFLLDLVW